MSKTVNSFNSLKEENSQNQTTTLQTKSKQYVFTNKHSSLISVNHPSVSLNTKDDTFDDDDDPIRNILTSSNSIDQITTNEHLCSLTQMLLVYAQQEVDRLTNPTEIHLDQSLNKILNVLELHFNTYADDNQQIYFEGIFQILHDFKEQITEFILIETMKLLKINPRDSCNFQTFILILCHLPPIQQDSHVFLDIFNQMDYNKDSYITFDDIQIVLPQLISHLNEETVHVAMHTINIDNDNNRLSYFDFVTSFIALQECQSTINNKTNTTQSLHTITR